MSSKFLRSSSLLLALGALATGAFAQTNLADWNFTAAVAPNDNTPAATSGVNASSASASTIGIDTPTDDVLLTGATGALDPNPASTQYAWRVRGTGGSAGNGWDASAAQYTQGTQFAVSTVGYSNVSFSFDWYSTKNGIADLQLQYTTDGTTWVNYTGSYEGNVKTLKSSSNTLLLANSKGYNTDLSGVTAVTNTVDFSGISGVSNDSKFAVRLVSAFDPTSGKYNAASGGVWDGSSGNWRFDQIQFKGTAQAVPEAPSVVLLALGGLGLVVLRNKRS